MATFSLMKQQAIELKRALDAENARFMALHGQVWDPSKDPDNAAGTGGNATDILYLQRSLRLSCGYE